MTAGMTTELNDSNANSLGLSDVAEFLRQACRRALSRFPDVHRWDQTDDVFQQAMLRLHQALQVVQPANRRHLENLAALQIRRTIIDLGRRYASAVAMNHNRWTPVSTGRGFDSLSDAIAGPETQPQKIIEWVELHEMIDSLPEPEKEVFELIWYRGLTRAEVAKLLECDLRTVQRKWRLARERLAKALGGTVSE